MFARHVLILSPLLHHGFFNVLPELSQIPWQPVEKLLVGFIGGCMSLTVHRFALW
jgi:hypothetical protein